MPDVQSIGSAGWCVTTTIALRTVSSQPMSSADDFEPLDGAPWFGHAPH